MATIRRFRQQIRGLFVSGDGQLTKHYLRFLVNRIVIHGSEVELHTRTDAAAQMMASGDAVGRPAEGGGPFSPTSVVGWLPTGEPRANFHSAFVIDTAKARKRLRSPAVRPPRVLQMLEQAEEFQRLLESGDAPSQAYLARAFGLTRARVTQILNLLKLHPEIIEFIRAMPTMPPRTWVTERRLRPLAALPQARQLRAAASELSGFAPSKPTTVRGSGAKTREAG